MATTGTEKLLPAPWGPAGVISCTGQRFEANSIALIHPAQRYRPLMPWSSGRGGLARALVPKLVSDTCQAM